MSSDISQLESSLVLWEGVEYVAIALVTVGVIGEFFAEFTKTLNETQRHRVGKAAALVLILGLALELPATVRTNGYSDRIIEAERSARVQLDTRTSNRWLTTEEFQTLSAAMSKYSEQPAEVVVFPVNFESDSIADLIHGILVNAKWRVGLQVTRLSQPPNGMLVQGVYIQATGDAASQAAGAALFRALSPTVASGVWTAKALTDRTEPFVWIFVGDKPTPLSTWVK